MKTLHVPLDKKPDILFAGTDQKGRVRKVVAMDAKGGKIRITQSFQDDGRR